MKRKYIIGAVILGIIVLALIFGIPSKCYYEGGDVRICKSFLRPSFWQNSEWNFEFDDDI